MSQIETYTTFLHPHPLPLRNRAERATCVPRSNRYARKSVEPRAQAPPPSPDPLPRRENNLLERLDAIPDLPVAGEGRKEVADSRSRVTEAIGYLGGNLSKDVERFFSSPFRLLTAGSLSILFGFFSATSASTIIGSVADWDPLAAAVLLVWTEGFTKYYYRLERKSKLLQLINSFKIGLMFGMAVDAFKLST